MTKTMKKKYFPIIGIALVFIVICSQFAHKSANMSTIYLITSLISFIILASYFRLFKEIPQKDLTTAMKYDIIFWYVGV